MPFFLCCGRTWSAWSQTRMRASSVVLQRSSLDWSEAANTGATQRYVCWAWCDNEAECSTLFGSVSGRWLPRNFTYSLFKSWLWFADFTRKINGAWICIVLPQVEGLWELLCPLLRTALSNITIETYADWGTCIATACVSFGSFASFMHLFPSVKLMSLIRRSVWLCYRRAGTHASFTGCLRC